MPPGGEGLLTAFPEAATPSRRHDARKPTLRQADVVDADATPRDAGATTTRGPAVIMSPPRTASSAVAFS
jgi:hypothetical protein